jgi:hypothetical protein
MEDKEQKKPELRKVLDELGQQLDNANELSRDIYRKINMFKDFTEPEPNCDKDEIPKIPTSVVISILWDYVESLKRINSRNMDNANHLTELVG